MYLTHIHTIITIAVCSHSAVSAAAGYQVDNVQVVRALVCRTTQNLERSKTDCPNAFKVCTYWCCLGGRNTANPALPPPQMLSAPQQEVTSRHAPFPFGTHTFEDGVDAASLRLFVCLLSLRDAVPARIQWRLLVFK